MMGTEPMGTAPMATYVIVVIVVSGSSGRHVYSLTLTLGLRL